jgi:hypothetical protein
MTLESATAAFDIRFPDLKELADGKALETSFELAAVYQPRDAG